MAHGARDFGIYAPKETIVTIEDLGELAVRLGSPVNYDRKGDVVWVDGFEDGIDKWDIDLTLGRGSFTWESAHSRDGGFSGLLTTGGLNGDEVWIFHYLTMLVFSKMGFEFSFTLSDDILSVVFGFWLQRAGKNYDASVKYLRADDKWQYFDAGRVWQDLSPIYSYRESADRFHIVKLVFNFDTEYYSHLIVDNATYDLSSYKLNKRDRPGDDFCYPYMQVKNNAAAAALSYIDSVIVTQNEP